MRVANRTESPAAPWPADSPPSPPPEPGRLRRLARRAWRAVAGPSGWRSVVGPAAFALLAIALLVYDHLNQRVTDLVFWLTLGLIVTIFLRILETNRKQSRALEAQRRDSINDRVTGLRNRTSLEADIEAAATAPGEGWVLILLELDGLQDYNDRFGYAGGDELLGRVARRLVDAVAPLGGLAYRIAAGRLAVLVPAGERRLGEVVLAATGSVRGDGSEALIGRSYGEVAIPADAAGAEDAFQIAGQRLAAHKQRQHRSARRQTHAALMAALEARHPELRDELRIAAYRAISLARRLGAEREEIDDVALAAGLQSVGLLAVPEVVLENEARFDPGDPAAIHSRALESERIVAAAPGLAPVARLVRAGAEHFDGSDGPDRLAGESIPLGARVIAVAIAFAAMTSPRPQRRARSAEEALLELRRGAGSRFDPRVVAALASDLAEEAPPAAEPVPATPA